MTLGEIYAVTWAFEMAHQPPNPFGSKEAEARIDKRLKEAREKNAARKAKQSEGEKCQTA